MKADSRAGWRMAGTLLLALALPVIADDKPASYYHDILPIFKKSCTGCHHPGKLKGELDLTSYEMLKKGGKHGASFTAGDPKASRLVEEISGDEPSMPKEGDPLSKEEVALVERWVKEGAKDDTPAGAGSFKLAAPPVYTTSPVISAMAYSPDGTLLAISGYHEVLLHQVDGSGPVARLVGESPRIESVKFSPDGKLLAVSGGAPAQFGEIQVWDVTAHTESKSFKVTSDVLFGVSFSPDAKEIAFGCTDKTARVIDANDGHELMKFDNHSDWIFCTTFSVDGKRLLTGSRDKAMKLINVANGQFIDDINKLLEGVLCFARHPKEDLIAYGGDLGTPRIYRMQENQGRTAANNDVNQVRAFERQPGPVYSIAYSPDGGKIAVGSTGGEVRVYNTSDGKRAATLKNHGGAVFSIVFNPSGKRVATGGYDGLVREFDPENGELQSVFYPV
ncbi:MAG TPA: c-type cytochrome domain-containing protein, partial [Verrucomicrobiae bacterium]|nr:c-type cytochrome domain-containing protein [Verrucomicrobiae bacterium]